jgi:hypothetical protein
MAETLKTASTPRSGATTASGRSTTTETERLGRAVLDEGSELGAAMLAVVQDNANAFFQEQRDRVADEIRALGELLHNSVRSMQHREGIVARCTEETASQIEGFADRLRTRSFRELTVDAEDLSRRYPLSFVSVATGMAFLAVRLMTAPVRPEPMAEGTPSTARRRAHPTGATMAGEADVVAGVSGGAAAEHGAGPAGED